MLLAQLLFRKHRAETSLLWDSHLLQSKYQVLLEFFRKSFF